MRNTLAITIAAAVSAPAFAQNSQPPCEIHVSGGANINHPFVARNFAASVAVKDPELASYETRGQAFATHPVVRAARLDTSRFGELVPPGRSFTVVYHQELQNDAAFKRRRERLFPSQAECYGDLMIYNLYTVLFPASGPNDYFGAATPLLAGGNRMVLTFEYHFFDGLNARPERIKESVDVRLVIPGIDRHLPMGTETTTGLKKATDAAFGLFLERHQRRLPSQRAQN